MSYQFDNIDMGEASGWGLTALTLEPYGSTHMTYTFEGEKLHTIYPPKD
jgi:hypothetical protein